MRSMFKENAILNAIVNEFSKLQEVEAILLAGSHTIDTQDENSDYDLYIYLNKEVPVIKRKEIMKGFCDYVEINIINFGKQKMMGLLET